MVSRWNFIIDRKQWLPQEGNSEPLTVNVNT